ncbi:MAG: UDP-glucose dehydrogenase family protein [Candidatus Eiseniibacteriota bacterium]
MSRIVVVGTGYVGLVTGACLADFGNEVRCVDADASKIARLERGDVPFFEPGLEELVARHRESGRLRFGTSLADAAQWAEAIFITVGTPPRKDGGADLSAIFAVGDAIAKSVRGTKVVVQKSTAPVGTARKLWDRMKRAAGRRAVIDVASNPEFLREGSAIETYMRPDRVIVGAETTRSERLMREIHEPLYLLETPITVTTLETAELIKYASNAFLATKISFINEVANLCEKVGADVQTVARAMGQDRRIGPKFLHAGPGYGGSCFPKDTLALASFARATGAPFRLVETVVEVNERQKARMIEKIADAAGPLRGRRIAVLGLTFKPNTDDIREAPALDIIAGLLRRGAAITAYDPVGMEHVRRLPLGRRLKFAKDAYAAAEGADAVVLVTEWNEFRTLDLRKLRRRMRRAVLCDLRNIYDADEAKAAGLTYVGVGQGAAGSEVVARAPKRRARPSRRGRIPAKRKAK